MNGRWSVVLASALLLAACGGSGGPEISDARLGQPTGPNAAVYFTATSGGDADRLVGATTDVAGSVQIHETMMGDDGTMSMQAVEALDLPADGTLVLEPGGYHLMLLGADRLEVGDTIEVTLEWETAGEQMIEAEVVDPGDTMTDG
ncbi:MAG: copper chaperone PCu(A)C [Acidimicrobiia bacterium]|jgi:copper(I)-binding protein